MDLNLALRVDSPTPLIDKSASDEKRDMERWEKSNRICMMTMKKNIPEAFRGIMSEKITMAKEFFADIEKREYIMEMSLLTSKLKALKLELSKDLLVYFVLISLPTQFI
ncbi:uncharacterized protein LOC112092055 [Morus notabilis]|uniref:uncharacterized protein LOC112092055 n=1 Tax=Morus notabilis TaxID=981085 RepID=UPI000CED2E9D|nr:uncharacterized protein LOC112092055 [Morus notabilis]